MDYKETEIKELVRHVLLRTLRQQQRDQSQLLTAEEVGQHAPGSSLTVPSGTLVTPMAREIALSRKIDIVEDSPVAKATPCAETATGDKGKMVVAIGTDHGGFQMKEMLKGYLQELGYQVLDMGTNSQEAVDYPDFAYAVALQVTSGKACRGIVLDGAGIGSCMVANKVPGIRAAMAYDQATAVNSRLHNNANVLTLGAGLLGPNLLKQIVKTWLSTDYEGGRHQRRVDKISAIEARYLKQQ